MYVDESGDCGTVNSPSKYFVLSALVIHEFAWQQFIEDLISFRRSLKANYNLKMSEEIHAGEFLSKRAKIVIRI
ncbi:MAG: DUF3800 domain-containing protein [Saprospiraceae bacterium]|nr:DUF3800 domain-containing protein [Saprospiraceae bacterium]